MFKLFILMILISCNKIMTKDIKCPVECKCDTFKNYRRASCTNRNLIMVDVDIPHQVQILNLSHNSINKLPDHIFYNLNLTSLKLLNISHNKIGDIHMNAFFGLDQVKTIDLSYNAIGYLMEDWFWKLSSLEELYLQGNSLQIFNPAPVIDSLSIKILNLQACSLLDVPNEAFMKLPNLEVLDLSTNALIQLKVEVIEVLPKLKTLTLKNNPWHCNDDIEKLINYCNDKLIQCKNPCTKNIVSKEEKFQKMIVEPALEILEEQNSWILEDDDDEKVEEKKPCVVTTSSKNKNNYSKSMLLEIIELSPILALLIPYTFGVISGLVLACTISKSFLNQEVKLKKQFFPKKPKQRNRIRKVADLHSCPLIDFHALENPNSTPMSIRKNIMQST